MPLESTRRPHLKNNRIQSSFFKKNEARDPTPVKNRPRSRNLLTHLRLDRDSNPNVKRRCAHQIGLSPIMKLPSC